MVRRGASKARARKAKLNEAAIMAEIEASVRKKSGMISECGLGLLFV